MNRSIKHTTVTLALAGFAGLAWSATTVISVNGMVCAFCAQGIEKRLSQLPQTQGVFVDLKKKIVAVEAKEGMTFDKKVLESEIRDAGYDVTKIEDSAHPLAHIKAGMKDKP